MIFLKGGDFMGIEEREEIGGQNDPAEFAVGEQQGPVDLAHEAGIRARSISEDGRNPSTHPLNRGGWKAPTGSEIAGIDQVEGPKDWALFRSVSGMDAGGE